MHDINDFLEKILKESCATTIISSPDTFGELQKEGLKPDSTPKLTAQEYIDKLYEEKKAAAQEAIKLIPLLPDVAVPTVNLLYKEIAECVLFGLNGAAITLSTILVEHALKYAIVKAKHGKEYASAEWDRIERIQLSDAVKEARVLGILDDTTEPLFTDFGRRVRNPYIHYNIKKLTKGVKAPVTEVNKQTREAKTVQWDAETNPMLWPFAKQFVDKKDLQSVLGFVRYAVELLLVKEGKEENGTAA